MLTEDGPLRIDVPRDREGSFEPLLIPNHERRFTGFDDKIVAMYARGMTMRGRVRFFVCEALLRLVHGGGRSALATDRPTDAVGKSVVAC